jgi:succinoglycan biosynthesis transport protein ExoP
MSAEAFHCSDSEARPPARKPALPARYEPDDGAGVPAAMLRVLQQPREPDGVGKPDDVRDWLRVLRRYRAMIGTIFGTSVGLAILVTLLMPSRYTAVTRLEVAHHSPIQLRLQDNVFRVEEGDRGRDAALTFLATQLAVLRSRDLAARVIQGRRLADAGVLVRAEASLGDAGAVVEMLRPRGWDGTSMDDGGSHGSELTPVSPDLIDRYEKSLSVRDLKDTDLVEVSFTTGSPVLSAFLAAAHTQAYMETNAETRQGTDAVARGFLDRQLDESRQRIVHDESALARFAAAYPKVATDQEQKIVGQRLAELSSRLTSYEAERLALESRYHFLIDPDTQALGYFLDQPGIQKLRSGLLGVQAQRAGLGQRLGPNHPEMLDIRNVEQELQRQIDAEVRQEVTGVRTRYDAERAREDRLRRRLAREERSAAKIRQLGARYELLKDDVETARALHTSLRKQRMDTAVNAELVATNVRVIDRPEVPQRPSRPNAPLNLAIGVVGGLVLSIGAAFARDYFDDSVKSSDEMTGLLNVPTLATIPSFDPDATRLRALALAHFRTLVARRTRPSPRNANGNGNGNGHDAGVAPRHELMVVHQPRSGVAEAFHCIRTALLLSAHGDSSQVMLVTSASSGEGKTVASANLALALAQTGARVVLVDADLRHPRVHAALGIPNDVGLSNLLLGRAAIADVVHTLDEPPLAVVTAGIATPNPAELLSSARIGTFFERLRAHYEFVVVDTPPVLAVTDAVLLAREADGFILVVKSDCTPRTSVRAARDRLSIARARFIGVVVNDVNAKWSDTYYYDSYECPRNGDVARHRATDAGEPVA